MPPVHATRASRPALIRRRRPPCRASKCAVKRAASQSGSGAMYAERSAGSGGSQRAGILAPNGGLWFAVQVIRMRVRL